MMIMMVLISDNAQLLDLFQTLNIQAGAVGSTLVSSNAELCFSAAVSWSRRNDSYLEYNLATVCLMMFALYCVIRCLLFLSQCGSVACTLYEVGAKCMSQCNNCGTLCESFPITDVNSLALYSAQGCTIIVGDLYIMGLSSSISQKPLFANLQGIQYIRGALHFQNNEYLSSVAFFKNLIGLHGAVYLNNPVLVDTRMPSLQQMTGNVSVIGCDRLCPARYTAAGVGLNSSDVGCTNVLLDYFMNIQGSVTVAMLPLVSDIMSRVVGNATGGVVCDILDLV